MRKSPPAHARWLILLAALITFLVAPVPAPAASCEEVVGELNHKLSPKIDEAELVEVVRALDESGNRKLPPQFVTKKEAKRMGWRPGKDLWSVERLKGKSIGGDTFGNRERKLPAGKWREADLDYKGGRRGPKRLVYSGGGLKMVSVDHYRSFREIPPCR